MGIYNLSSVMTFTYEKIQLRRPNGSVKYRHLKSEITDDNCKSLYALTSDLFLFHLVGSYEEVLTTDKSSNVLCAS